MKKTTILAVALAAATLAAWVSRAQTVVRLFSELAEVSIESLDANANGQTFMNGFLPDYYVEQARTVRIHEAELRRLENTAMVDPGGLNGTIDLTIFPDRPCTFSSLRNVSKRDDGSVSIIYAQCDNVDMSHNASISFNARNGTVSLQYNDREKYYRVVSLEDSDFGVALSLKPASANPLTGL